MVAFDRNPQDFKYLRLLSRQFPTEQSAFTEIINLSAILNLPKGTEHFMSDVHGEYEAFMHILNNCSGVVREHVDEIFGDTLTFDEKGELCTLIYYPREKIRAGPQPARGLPHLVQDNARPAHHGCPLAFEPLYALQGA